MKVVGAGFGRTGTHSLKLALDQLGFGPCDHMYEVMGRPDRVSAWYDIVTGASPDWDRLFHGFNSVVDWPAAAFCENLAGYYSDARLILTVRDPQDWFRSMDQTILPVLRNPGTLSDTLPFQLLTQRTFGGDLSKSNVISTFTAHNARIRRLFGPERLLVHDARDGWGPLCRFLQVQEPDKTYPRGNSPEEFKGHMARLN